MHPPGVPSNAFARSNALANASCFQVDYCFIFGAKNIAATTRAPETALPLPRDMVLPARDAKFKAAVVGPALYSGVTKVDIKTAFEAINYKVRHAPCAREP